MQLWIFEIKDKSRIGDVEAFIFSILNLIIDKQKYSNIQKFFEINR